MARVRPERVVQQSRQRGCVCVPSRQPPAGLSAVRVYPPVAHACIRAAYRPGAPPCLDKRTLEDSMAGAGLGGHCTLRPGAVVVDCTAMLLSSSTPPRRRDGPRRRGGEAWSWRGARRKQASHPSSSRRPVAGGRVTLAGPSPGRRGRSHLPHMLGGAGGPGYDGPLLGGLAGWLAPFLDAPPLFQSLGAPGTPPSCSSHGAPHQLEPVAVAWFAPHAWRRVTRRKTTLAGHVVLHPRSSWGAVWLRLLTAPAPFRAASRCSAWRA